jgi:pilus assembly protein CpaE
MDKLTLQGVLSPQEDTKMTTPHRSILVISPDKSLTDSIGTALSSHPELRVETQSSTLAQMNGSAVTIAQKFDMVLFQTRSGDQDDLKAIRAIAAGQASGTTLVALADRDITLAEALALNRAGVRDVLPMPEIAAEFGEQIARLGREHATASATGKVGHIIAVAQSRGGVGSTTVAVNLADQLLGGRGNFLRRDAKNTVAIVDFDLQFGTVGSYLDVEEQDTLLQLAQDGTVPDATFLRQSMVTLANGLNVLAAPSKFAPLDSLRAEQVAAILDTLRQSHDYVVVDLPRALVGWIEPILQRADEVILVTDIGVSSVRHCRRLIDFFTADNVALPIKVVVNHERRPMVTSRLQREAEKALDRKFDHWLPHDPKAAHNAADRGKPLSTTAPRASLTKAFAQLAATTIKSCSSIQKSPSK